MKAFNEVVRMVTAGVLIAIAGSVAAQQAYPNKPIRLITPYAAGGTTDILSRLVGQKLTESWGQSVIVLNRGGGNTMIGTEALAKSAPDGYTLMLMAMPHVIVPLLLPAPYDPIKDFAAIGTVASNEQVLVVNSSLPVNNLQEFIALAKSKPGQLNFATVDSGGPGHLLMESLNIMVGAKMLQVPYKGSGPAMNAILGNEVHVYLAVPGPIVPSIKAGRLKALAVSGNARMSTLPEVPTFAESGLQGFDARTWYGVLAPAGTPKDIIDKLSAEIARIVALPDIQERLHTLAVTPFISTADQFAKLMITDMARYKKIIETTQIKIVK